MIHIHTCICVFLFEHHIPEIPRTVAHRMARIALMKPWLRNNNNNNNNDSNNSNNSNNNNKDNNDNNDNTNDNSNHNLVADKWGQH